METSVTKPAHGEQTQIREASALKISIVTPVLNGAPFVADAVRSVLRQSHDDLDYLIIDAGSTDGTQDIVNAEINGDGRARLIVRPAESLYRSIIWGLEQAQGDVLCWLNADDLYTSWAFAAIEQFARNNPEARWFSGLPGCWDKDGVLRMVRNDAWRPRQLIAQGWFHRDLLGFIQQESIFFSRSLFGALSSEEREKIAASSLAGDFMLWKRLARHAPLTLVPTVLGGFRRHGANQSIAKSADYMEEVKKEGAIFLPPLLRGVARRSFQSISCNKTFAASLREDAEVV